MNSTEKYAYFCKPKLTQLFASLGLDVNYVKARGNLLTTDDGREVLDCISGFGSAILGHNHPALVQEMIENLANATPVVAQGSIHSDTAELAERLNQYMPGDARYLVHFSNSGTEAVEAAIKHAYKVHYDKIEKEYERITRLLDDFYYQYEHAAEKPELPEDKKLIDFRDDLDEYNLEQFESFKNKPVVISFKGAYHGKSTSSLKVTFNKSFREAFEGLSAIQNVFLDIDKPHRIPEIAEQEICTFYYPTYTNGRVELRPRSLTRVMAFIFEPIVGEGGIIPLPEATLRYLAEHHEKNGVPYIIDEIQTGCGRTGEIYSYAATPLAAISPEYVLLSKSLGGGLSKIGATLIKHAIYEQDFGILHTSTFGEDKLASRTALKVLELLTADGNAILKSVKEKGAYLLRGLNEVKMQFPQVIKEVRGDGLMIGIEFTPLDQRSPFFRASGKQGVLSLLVASYLMHYYGIRVLAPISTMLKGNPGKKRLSIVRIQPSALIEAAQMDTLIRGVREVCDIINNNNEYCFVGHLAGGAPTAKERAASRAFPAKYPMNDELRHIDARVGFVLHPTTVERLIEYYFPSFEDYTVNKPALKQWWDRISRFLEPVHVKNEYITSNDFVVEMALVFVPYLPDYITSATEPYIQKEIRDKVQDGVTIARELGDDNIPVSIVGLGAYTSIATRNGETVNYYEMPITTGNAYTVGLSIQGVIYAADTRGIDIGKATIAVVGAGGNIGSVMAKILTPRAGRLMLIGSGKGAESRFRLDFTKKECISDLLDELAREGTDTDQLGAIARAADEAVGGSASLEAERRGDAIAAADEALSTAGRISTHVDFSRLKEADIVIVATNSADEELIGPNDVKEDAIVCGTSVPSNLSLSFASHTPSLSFDGGFARLPDDSQINFVGMPTDGMAYGCLAETLVLGFDGQNHSFSKGPLTSKHVYDIMEIAQTHGFDLGTLKFDDAPLNLQ